MVICHLYNLNEQYHIDIIIVGDIDASFGRTVDRRVEEMRFNTY